MRKQLGNLTDEEKDILKKMTDALSQRINFNIRKSVKKGIHLDKFKKEMDLISTALNKGEITEDIKVYRKTVVGFLFDAKKISDLNLNEITGKTIVNEIFTSTSFDLFDYPQRDVLMVMNVPKGTKRVLYIKDLAYDGVKHQEEILFDRGLTYTIRNAKIEKMY